MISQRYGVQLKKLMKYNRLSNEAQLIPGTQLWLSSRMPKKEAMVVPVAADEVLGVSEQVFEWNTSAPKAQASVTIPTLIQPSESVAPESTEQAIEANSTKKEHIVLQGETLYSIAKNYSVTVGELARWNELNLQEGIRPGQALKVVAPEMVASANDVKIGVSEPVSAQYHEVKNSDTLYSVARQYGVTIKELMDWNSKTDFSVSVGEKLKVSPQ